MKSWMRYDNLRVVVTNVVVASVVVVVVFVVDVRKKRKVEESMNVGFAAARRVVRNYARTKRIGL